MKLAVISRLLPPSPSGQAMVLYRLLSGLDPRDYCLISTASRPPAGSEPGPTCLPARTFYLTAEPDPAPAGRLGALLAPVSRPARLLQRVLGRARRVSRIVKGEGCGAVVACSGDLADMPAALVASRWTRRPLYAYMFDDYRYQWPLPWHRTFASFVERAMARRLAGLIVPNEFLAREYFDRYGIEATVVHNASDTAEDLRRPNDVPWPERTGTISIVYTGAVYHAQLDAFRNLLDALSDQRLSHVRLHVYTSQDPESLELQAVPSIVFHEHLPEPEARAVQRRADILFLPLAFGAIPEVIRTSAPGKMGEYLSSGRPVLVHAPGDSFVADYFSRHECGVVVAESDTAQLAEAVLRLIDDGELRGHVVRGALSAARADFDLAVERERFLEVFASAGRR